MQMMVVQSTKRMKKSTFGLFSKVCINTSKRSIHKLNCLPKLASDAFFLARRTYASEVLVFFSLFGPRRKMVSAISRSVSEIEGVVVGIHVELTYADSINAKLIRLQERYKEVGL